MRDRPLRISFQILLAVEELEERIAPDVLGGGNPAQSAYPENTATPEGSAVPEGGHHHHHH